MTIKILPARLANQIAAGEVVERPASVVKELVENSLDSGATRIDVDIEKGGAKLIRIRDNGKGIVKDELQLALSRHATSKIHTLDDLEAIISLGFRGEALASISSVSRLTLTSRPATQQQAWSAYAEGREMAVKIQPTAHPIGTTVEVLDLFFNTPARRKFLRTEKTEFTHIDELLKRIALSRFDITINLKHNGKMVRQYRAAKTEVQCEKRIASVCGNAFVRNMLRIELEHNELKLHGWIATPEGARSQSDMQFCYVNGRMMRDKLINHAIRQSYETSLTSEQYAAYILFIEIDPHHVDVNVHPAKHEVRFHQSRLVHDFIYQALASALSQAEHIEQPKVSAAAFHTATDPQSNVNQNTLNEPDSNSPLDDSLLDAIEKVPNYPGRSGYQKELSPTTGQHLSVRSREPGQTNEWQSTRPQNSYASSKQHSSIREKAPSRKEVDAYQQLMSTPLPNDDERGGQALSSPCAAQVTPPVIRSLGKSIAVVHDTYLLMTMADGCALVSVSRAEWWRSRYQLDATKATLKAQPLLVPLAMKLPAEQLQVLDSLKPLLSDFAIELKVRDSKNIMVMAVPQPLRQQNLQLLIGEMLAYLAANLTASPEQLACWLAGKVQVDKSHYTLSEAIQVLAELERLTDGQLPLNDSRFVKPVDFSTTIAALIS
jgi:DNA mismatch repair protein MutL